jgi:hypothetical protein
MFGGTGVGFILQGQTGLIESMNSEASTADWKETWKRRYVWQIQRVFVRTEDAEKAPYSYLPTSISRVEISDSNDGIAIYSLQR